jgi:hypothetical protein
MLKLLSLTLLLTSCTQFVQNTDDEYFDVIDNKTKSEHLSLIFSHNINGETHPCGCRSFPLGGLPQVAGELYDLRSKVPLFYVDTGDAFFPSTQVPALLEKSQVFTAKKIAESFDANGLDLFLPGDQDFAFGEDFLAEISKKHKFNFLISNLSPKSKIKHTKWIAKKFGNQNIVFLGILEPSLLPAKHRDLVTSPYKSVTDTLKIVEEKLGKLENLRIVLLSHSGMDFDKRFAKKFPQINWIIGSHSQAFTQLTVDVGQTKIVQVLSRNHYLGHIKIAANNKAKDSFKVIEVRDELKDKWKKNKMLTWLDEYKTSIDAIQLEEQKLMTSDSGEFSHKSNTAASCLECHKEQSEFWQGTAHSIAYVTLENAKSGNNPNCIGCHSLNYKKLDGFQNTDDMVLSNKNLDKYWKEWESNVHPIKSIRKLSSKKIKSHAKKWMKLDEKNEITHNFANVQCLNCHDKAGDHPFEMDDVVKKTTDYMSKCLKCHTNDQSPSWYSKNDKGIATTVNKSYVSGIIKKIACPKRKE